MTDMLFRGVTFNVGQNMNSSEMGTRWATTTDLCSHFMEERCRKNLSNWAKLQPDWSSQTKIHSYKSKVTASGLGAPLVIKHLSQEEPKVAQHDQWYWSMVSTICNNVAGDYPGHASWSLVIFLWICFLFVWYCSHCFPIRCKFARYYNLNWLSSGERKNATKLCRCLAGQSSSSALQLRLIQQFWWRKYKWIHHNRTLKNLNGSLSLSSICHCQMQLQFKLGKVRFKWI